MARKHDRPKFGKLISDMFLGAKVPVDSNGEAVLTLDEVCRLFEVSNKTIFRWRRRGLAASQYTFDDGRRRLGCTRPALLRFARENENLVRNSRDFCHLSAEERQLIINRAGNLRDTGLTEGEVLRSIARHTDRCIETIRAAVLKHDQEHPDRAIFGERETRSIDALRTQIFACHLDGTPIAELARKFDRSEAYIRRTIRIKRIQRVREFPLEHIYNDEFVDPDADAYILAPPPEAQGSCSVPAAPGKLPAYLRSLYETALLETAQEQHLFRRYNYLKYEAGRLRAQLDPVNPNRKSLREIERLYQLAEETKFEIVKANLRLVVSIAKRYVGPEREFFELVSDGNMSLLRAVEKFDYARGNKFSTYASWAIQKNFLRASEQEKRQRDRYHTSLDELLADWPEDREDPHEAEADQRRRGHEVRCLLRILTERERRIITRRFGLGSGRRPQTLKEVGVEIGVSKERVRQLEARAMAKLRRAAQDADIDFTAI